MKSLPESARLKLELMFDGVRYSDALGKAAEHAFPNFYPYRFHEGEENPTGQPKATIPYLMAFDDGTMMRVKGNWKSPWKVVGDRARGYRLHNGDDIGSDLAIEFDPLPKWMQQQTSDGFPMAQAGVSLHGDMAVINIAPGCDYFLEKGANGHSMRCSFCAYGAPNARVSHYQQVSGQPGLPDITYQRMKETLSLALQDRAIGHIYLVAGSLTDWRLEADRFIEVARHVQEVNQHRVPVTCGSGALPKEKLLELHGLGLVDAVCFNLEIWGKDLFERV